MIFDSLVTRLELGLLPIVRREEAALRSSGRFSKIEVLSLRHTKIDHAIGIACRPTWAAEEFEHLSLVASVTGFEGLSGRINVQWSQVFAPSTGSGYLKKETGGFHGMLTSEAEIMRFEKEWLRLFAIFQRVAARGNPSPYWLRRFRGAPRDLHGFKEEANQPLQRNASTRSVSNFESPARRG